jgi:hypothetical protein
MKIIFLFIFLFIYSNNSNSKMVGGGVIGNQSNTDSDISSPSTETKPFFKNKDLNKPKNTIVNNDFDITYSFFTINETCKVPIEIKNISKEEKRNTFSVEVYSYGNKKYEAFIAEKRSKPGEIVSTQITFKGIECDDIKRISFYR